MITPTGVGFLMGTAVALIGGAIIGGLVGVAGGTAVVGVAVGTAVAGVASVSRIDSPVIWWLVPLGGTTG